MTLHVHFGKLRSFSSFQAESAAFRGPELLLAEGALCFKVPPTLGGCSMAPDAWRGHGWHAGWVIQSLGWPCANSGGGGGGGGGKGGVGGGGAGFIFFLGALWSVGGRGGGGGGGRQLKAGGLCSVPVIIYLWALLGWLTQARVPTDSRILPRAQRLGGSHTCLPFSVHCSVSLAGPVTSVIGQNPVRSQAGSTEGLGLSPYWAAHPQPCSGVA